MQTSSCSKTALNLNLLTLTSVDIHFPEGMFTARRPTLPTGPTRLLSCRRSGSQERPGVPVEGWAPARPFTWHSSPLCPRPRPQRAGQIAAVDYTPLWTRHALHAPSMSLHIAFCAHKPFRIGAPFPQMTHWLEDNFQKKSKTVPLPHSHKSEQVEGFFCLFVFYSYDKHETNVTGSKEKRKSHQWLWRKGISS